MNAMGAKGRKRETPNKTAVINSALVKRLNVARFAELHVCSRRKRTERDWAASRAEEPEPTP